MCFQAAPVCSVELTLVDIYTGDTVPIEVDVNLTLPRNNITFTSQQLVLGRLYNATVRAENVAGLNESYILLGDYENAC